MTRCDFAVWDPISGPAGNYTGGPFKVVHHKTQGASLEGARSAYRANRSDPHFTVHRGGVRQHIDTSLAARSLRNESGGAQTNRDSVIQIEVVGFSGETMDSRTMEWLIRLLRWIGDTHRIPWDWPEGRPPLTSATGYGKRTQERNTDVWDHRSGHYGHSQVPENDHWDPAYTDAEWDALNKAMAPPVVTPPPTNNEEESMAIYPTIKSNDGNPAIYMIVDGLRVHLPVWDDYLTLVKGGVVLPVVEVSTETLALFPLATKE